MKFDKKLLRDVLLLLLGTALITLSINIFVIPNNLATNGLSGLSVVLYHAVHIDPSLSFFMFNVPLLLLGYKFLGKKLFFLTIVGAMSLSGWMFIWEQLPWIQLHLPDMVLVAGICDGVISGLGVGLAIKSGGSSGGSAILSLIFHHLREIPVNKTLFFVDVMVMVFALMTYLDFVNFAITILSCYIASQVVKLVVREKAVVAT